MSFDLALDGKYVFYLNFRTLGDGITQCVSEQNFSFSSLIENASKYICAVDRWRIPIQGIPMLAALRNAITVQPRNADPPVDFHSPAVYSLYEWIIQVNNNLPSIFTFDLTADGRARINFDFTDNFITLNQKIADIFDMPTTVGLGLTGTQSIVGASVMLDRFDDLYKIQILAENGLQALQPEIQTTNQFLTLITDYIIPSNFSLSNTNLLGSTPNGNLTFQFPLRQDLEFNASTNRRFQMIRGSAPIQNVSVRAVAIFRDGTTHEIVLPPRSVFELKLAFFRR